MYESRVEEIERIARTAYKTLGELTMALRELKLATNQKELVAQIVADIRQGKSLEYVERTYLGEEGEEDDD